jgi:hypothetical protein
MDKWILRLLLSLAKVFIKEGVDFDRLTIITETKLTMDRRRVRANYNQQKNKAPKNPLMMTLIVYGFFGLMMGIMIGFTKSLILSMIFFHAYLLFMMAMTLITDFSAVLLDTADHQIILPRPINSKTIFLARLFHILVYLLQFTIALAVFPLIAIFITHGPLAGIAAFFTILLTVALAVFFTYLLYILILRFGNEQKVKDIIGYFQIFMTLLFTVGYQLLPRLIDFENIVRSFTLHWYSYFLPPVWMALSIESVQQLKFDALHLLMILCAFIIPIVTFWIMIKYLAPSFAHKLSLLQNDQQSAPKTIENTLKKRTLSSRFSSLFCFNSLEKAGYELVWKITGRDKGFKMQFYPSLGYILVFVFIIVFKSGKNFQTTLSSLPDSKLFLWMIYLPMFSVSTSKTLVAYYENFQAAWVYQSTPVKYPGQIISGSLKALLTKFFLPPYLLLFAFSYYTWGAAIIDDFVFGFFNNCIIFLLLEVLSKHFLPFSQQLNIKMQSGRIVKVLLQLIVIAALVGLHYLALNINWLVIILTPVAATAAYFLIKKVKSFRWKDMTV